MIENVASFQGYQEKYYFFPKITTVNLNLTESNITSLLLQDALS